jgi:primosomal protein N' (replication factor Y)
VRILLPWGAAGALTYLWPEERLGAARPGLRVEVPLGRSRRVGILLSRGGGDDDPAAERLRPVSRVLDDMPLWSADVLELVLWAAEYYRVSPGDFVRLVLPPGLRRIGRRDERVTSEEGGGLQASDDRASPSPDQGTATARTHAFTPEGFLDLLTREGGGLPVFSDAAIEARTALYREAISTVLRGGRSVLVLAPTIPRGAALRDALAACGLPVAFYHGDLPEREKAALWQQAARAACPILVGLRTAVFLPRPALGLLVVDEEHEAAYRQEGRVPYHARDLAVVRSRLAGARILISSATPSLETVRNLRLGRYARLGRLQYSAPRPRVAFRRVDPRRPGTVGGLAAAALDAVGRHLAAGGRVAVYLNRRGYARALLCPACGWRGRCTRCGVETAVHLGCDALVCPHCGRREPLPSLCPSCAGPLRARGGGIERLVHVLRLRFPEECVRTCEAPGDRGNLEARILVGTRRLRPALAAAPASLLLIADADAALVNPEFRARERFAQDLYALAATLAPAASFAPEILVQTRGVDEEALTALLSGSYPRFALFEDRHRRRARLPPYAAWALIEAGGRDEGEVRTLLERLRAAVETLEGGSVGVYGPLPLFARRRERARARLLLQADGRMPLRRVLVALDALQDVGRRRQRSWHVLVDPEDLI